MKCFLVKICCAFLLLTHIQKVNAQTIQIEGMTVDIFLSGNPSDSTVMYFPGCSGRDEFGIKYQDFHIKKIFEAWRGKVNIVRLQLVNDITKGATDGICFWSVEKNKQTGAESFPFATKAGYIAKNWIAHQNWFNGNLHFFGYSYGGRVSLMINFIHSTRNVFKTVTGIWPLCKKEYPISANAPHTPTRFYSTELDPLSDIHNCRSFYPDGGGDMIEIITYPGNEHSWMTHPDVKYTRTWWPNLKVWSVSKYIESYAEKTWTSWVDWAKCKETQETCN